MAVYGLLRLIIVVALGATPTLQDAPAPASQAAPASSQSAEPPPEVVELIKRLDDPDYAQREDAERQLLALVTSQPAMQAWVAEAAQSNASPEVRTRLASVLARLAEHRLLGASLVSLRVTDVHPRELINELALQSGVRFEYWPHDPWEVGGAAGGKVSLELQAVPFWDALQRVSETTSIYPVEHQPAAPGSIVLSQHAERLSGYPTAHHGAFAVQLRRLYRNQSSQIDLGVEQDGRIGGASRSSSSLSVDLRLLVEPKVRLSASMTQPVLEEAVDESGRDLLLPSETRRINRLGWSNTSNQWAVQSSLSLDAKAASGSQRIARLRGQLEAEIAMEVARLELKLADLADLRRLRPDEKVPLSKRYTIGSYQIELTSLRRAQDDSIYVDFTITPQAGSPEQLQEEWVRMQAMSNALRLEDASGRLWSPAAGNTGWDGTSAQISRGFHRGGDSAGPAVQLVWEIPAKIMRISIPFEFTDIPLPTWD